MGLLAKYTNMPNLIKIGNSFGSNWILKLFNLTTILTKVTNYTFIKTKKQIFLWRATTGLPNTAFFSVMCAYKPSHKQTLSQTRKILSK